MAERRMFAKTIIDSDSFLDLPLSSQSLYFHLSMRADDEGFVNNPKKIQRMIGASDDDLKLLVVKKFIIPFDSGIVVIKHWKIHNYIQNDRFKETVYTDERALLSVKKNKAYTLDTECIHDGYSLETQVSLNNNSVGDDSIEESDAQKGQKEKPNPDFDLFWQSYPKKVGKQDAKKAFLKAIKSNDVTTEKLIEAVEKQKRSDQWSRDNGRYIPNPATWLNQGRWDDELPKAVPESKPSTKQKSNILSEEMTHSYDMDELRKRAKL